MEQERGSHGVEKKRKRERSASSSVYWGLDTASEYLIYAVLIFTPWAFGTTERWAIVSVNAWNYLLGLLLVAKWITRAVTGFQPPRWDGPTALRGVHPRWVVWPMGILTVLLLGYCALSAWNARADYFFDEQRFEYFDNFNPNLPHSFDRSSSWESFRLYLAAACFFWAVRDWVRTKTRREDKAEREVYGPAAIGPDAIEAGGGYSYDPSRFPSRLKKLLWVICFNGALLAVQGTLQRLSGSRDLLWVVRPRMNSYPWQQFGPFNYRTNGAQYLNMIWPLALAFWWALSQQRKKKFGEGSEFLLLPFTGLMLVAPIIANSRGGVVVAVAQIGIVIGIFAYAFRKSGLWKTALAAALLLAIAGSGAALTWTRLKGHFSESSITTLGGRTEIYENARKMVEQYPVWGTGPGTFGAMYQFYRDPEQTWYAFTHDDYLQTMVTFGRVGFVAILSMLVFVFGYWFLARGIPTSGLFVGFLWAGVAGCLLHARFDFPMQNYSILLLFLTLCAVLTTMARRK